MFDQYAGLEFGEVPVNLLQHTLKSLQGSAADAYTLPWRSALLRWLVANPSTTAVAFQMQQLLITYQPSK